MPPIASGPIDGQVIELSSFVGRRDELRQLRAVMRSRRLVTLVNGHSGRPIGGRRGIRWWPGMSPPVAMKVPTPG